MRHIVNCPHSRLAVRQPNDLISVLAGPLKLLTYLLLLVFHHPSLFHSRLKTFLFCKSSQT